MIAKYMYMYYNSLNDFPNSKIMFIMVKNTEYNDYNIYDNIYFFLGMLT